MRGWYALAVCACVGLVFALYYPGSVPKHVEDTSDLDVEPNADGSRAAGSLRCAPANTGLDGKLLAGFLERLESRRSHAARCATFNQLAVHAALGDAAISVLEKYAHQNYPTRVRVCAVNALGFAVSHAAIASLLALARTTDAPLREPLVQALASREETAASEALVALARDPDSALRIPAAVALAQLGAREAVSLIEELLQEPGVDAKRLIIALGESGDAQALGVLQRLLARSDGLFTQEICVALAELGTPESTRLLLSAAERWHGATRDESWFYGVLARSNDPGAQQAVLSAAEGGKRSALEALTGVDSLEVRAWMLRALEHADSARSQAAMAYFRMHPDQRAIAGLSKLAQSSLNEGARAAVRALGSIGGQSAGDALEMLAATPGPLQTLALSTFAQQPESAERAQALAISLLKLGDAAPSNALSLLATDTSPEAHAALLKAAQSGTKQSQRAIWLLAKRDDPESLHVLSEIARNERAPNRLSALSALAEGQSPQAAEVMRHALRSEDPAVREEAVRRYGDFEAPEVEQAMLTASADATPEVAAAAVTHLGELGTAPALDRLESIATASTDTVARQALESLASAAPERAVAVVDSLVQQAGGGGLQLALSAVTSLPAEAGQRVIERALTSSRADVVSEGLTQILNSQTDTGTFSDALDHLAHAVDMPSELRELARNLLQVTDPEMAPAVDP